MKIHFKDSDVRFEASTAKIFWVVTPCSVVVEYQCFGVNLKMEAAWPSETLVFYHNTAS
jgi:hypothetical protein